MLYFLLVIENKFVIYFVNTKELGWGSSTPSFPASSINILICSVLKRKREGGGVGICKNTP